MRLHDSSVRLCALPSRVQATTSCTHDEVLTANADHFPVQDEGLIANTRTFSLEGKPLNPYAYGLQLLVQGFPAYGKFINDLAGRIHLQYVPASLFAQRL